MFIGHADERTHVHSAHQSSLVVTHSSTNFSERATKLALVRSPPIVGRGNVLNICARGNFICCLEQIYSTVTPPTGCYLYMSRVVHTS